MTEMIAIEKINSIRSRMQGNNSEIAALVDEFVDGGITSESADYHMAVNAMISGYMWCEGRTDEGMHYLERAKKFSEYAIDKESLVDVYVQAGNYEYLVDNYSEAGNWYFKAIELSELIGFEDQLGRIYNNIGSLFVNNKAFDKAMEYYILSEKFAKQNNEYHILPMLYTNLTELSLASGAYEQAEKYSTIAEKYLLDIDNPIRRFNYVNNRWHLMLHKKRMKDAQMCYQEACVLLCQIPIGNDHVVGTLGIFDNLVRMGESEQAVKQLKDSIKALEEINDYQNLKKYYHHMVVYYQDIENAELEIEYIRKENKCDEELQKKVYEERLKSLRGLDERYKLLRDERESTIVLMDTLNNENNRLHAFNNNLKAIHEIGVSIVSTTQRDEIFKLLAIKMHELFQIKEFAIGIVNEDKTHLDFEYVDVGAEGRSSNLLVALDDDRSFSVQCFKGLKEVVINDYAVENPDAYKQKLESGKRIASIIYLPILIDEEATGVMTIQHHQKNAFSPLHLEVFRLLSTFVAVSIKNAEQNKALAYLAEYDELTEIPNRRTFNEVYGRLFNEAKLSKQPLSVMIMDIDYFKQYNDTYGHLMGDACIKSVASALMKIIHQERNHIARYGGDEFIMVLPNTDAKSAETVAQRLVESIRMLKIPHSESLVSRMVSISLGVSCRLPRDDEHYDVILHEADKALYLQKKAFGRNGYYVNKL